MLGQRTSRLRAPESLDAVFGVHLRRIEAFAGTRRAAVACFAAALAVFGLESLAWPLFHGRDDGQYLQYYLDYLHSRPVSPELMTYRTPIAPFFYGPLLQFGGAIVTETAAAVAFALSTLAVAAAARRFSSWAGIVTAIVLLAYPAYGALFHQVSSDPAFAALFAFWLWWAVRTADRPTPRSFAILGLLVALMILARPAGQVFLLVAFFPLVLRLPWRDRLLGAAAFAGVAGTLLLGWALHNHVRYDDFAISRTSGAQVPMYRVFIVDRIAGPDYGPASRKLARAVDVELLTKQPYRAYGITLHEFYASGSSRMWEDLIGLSDRLWGWGSDYGTIRAAAVEAIEAHPRLYAYNVARSLEYVLRAPYVEPAPARVTSVLTSRARGTILSHGRRLPRPTEDQPIPAAHLFWEDSTPDGRIWLDWTSLAHPVERYRSSEDARHAAALVADRQRLLARYPNRDGSPRAAGVLNSISSHYPPIWLWTLVGLAAIAWRRPRLGAAAVVASALGLGLIVATAASVPPVPQYRVPMDPAFIVLVTAGLFGVRRTGGCRADTAG